MTEDEAKTKWCPHVRVTASSHEWHTNRPSHADVETKPFDHCIASACMAWRVQRIEAFTESAYNQEERPEGEGWQPRPGQLRHLAWFRNIPARDEGFCGLAGAPQ